MLFAALSLAVGACGGGGNNGSTSTSGATTGTTGATTGTTGAITGTTGATTGTTGSTTGGGWHAIAMPAGQDDASVTAVYCTSGTKCIITTHENTGDPGGVFAATDSAVGDKLVDGTYPGAVPTAASELGDVDFDGIELTRNGVVARADVSGAYISATGDFTQKASWTVVGMGKSGGDTLPLNGQDQIQVDASGNWIFINHDGFVYSSTTAPSDTTAWTEIWSPEAVPPVPADFVTQLGADPTLCDSDVSAGGLPTPSDPNYVSQDLSLIVYPAGGLNQMGSAPPGVCISTDKGVHFDATNPGPHGVTCLDGNHCFAYNGLPSQAGTAYIYYTSNAAMGKASTWTAATVPASFATADNVELSGIFFAPDGMHGWCVGDTDHHALLLKTADGGHSWTDISTKVAGVLDNDLYNGFALDNDHVWLTGRFGTLMATTTAQQ
jgi:hypothetical protein